MSMSTEEALGYLKGEVKEETAKTAETAKEPEVKEETPSVEPEQKETKSEETDVSSPEDAKKDDGEQPKDELKGSDEPKDEPKEVTKDKELSKQDYAFMKQKDKNKKLQAKYDKLEDKFNETNKQKDARIKELEDQLKKYESLKSEDFKKQDGTVDYDAYTDWKIQQRDMQNEVSNLKKSQQADQIQHAIDYDRYVTERCFSGQELEDYDNLIATKGGIFANEIHKVDPNNVVFNYLETLNDYPIVLRELMVNPNRWLGQMFRSRDPDIMKFNTARVADQILSEYYQPKVQPQTAAKPAIPVIGKQITNAGATAPEQVSLTSSMKSINDYLAKHQRH